MFSLFVWYVTVLFLYPRILLFGHFVQVEVAKINSKYHDLDAAPLTNMLFENSEIRVNPENLLQDKWYRNNTAPYFFSIKPHAVMF